MLVNKVVQLVSVFLFILLHCCFHHTCDCLQMQHCHRECPSVKSCLRINQQMYNSVAKAKCMSNFTEFVQQFILCQYNVLDILQNSLVNATTNNSYLLENSCCKHHEAIFSKTELDKYLAENSSLIGELQKKSELLFQNLTNIYDTMTSVNISNDNQIKTILNNFEEVNRSSEIISTNMTKLFERNNQVEERIQNITEVQSEQTAKLLDASANVSSMANHIKMTLEEIKKNFSTIQNDVVEMNRSNERLSENITHLFDRNNLLEENVQKLDNSTSQNIAESKNELTKKLLDVSENVNDLNNYTKMIFEQMQKNLTLIETKNEEASHNLKKSVEAIKQSLEDGLNEIHNTIRENNVTCERRIIELESHLSETIATKLESLKEQLMLFIGTEVEKIKSEHDILHNNVKAMEKDKDEVIIPNLLHKGIWVIYSVIVFLVVVLNLMCTTYLYHNKSSSSTKRVHRGDMSKVSNSLCLLSFDEVARLSHKELVESLMSQLPEQTKLGIDLNTHVVRKHEDILRIPPAKLFFVFPEFSERHVIIEQPGLGLGDLKRKTVQAIKEPFVMIYSKDPGSRNLSPNVLYNHQIDCVTSQQELIDLNEQGCFLSIYDKFTDCQKNHLIGIINRNFSS